MAHVVFISYSTQDKAVAEAVCGGLEGHGLQCWMAPRDVLPGTSYEEAIIRAINESRAFVLVYSATSNHSAHVENEVRIAWTRDIPIVPFILENVPLSDIMNYYIGSKHWLDATAPPLEKSIKKLADNVEQLVRAQEASKGVRPAAAPGTAPEPAPGRRPAPKVPRDRRQLLLPLAGVAVVAVIVLIAALYLNDTQAHAGPSPTPASGAPTPGPTVTLMPPGKILQAPPGSVQVPTPELPSGLSAYKVRIIGGINPNVTVGMDDLGKMAFVRLDRVEKKNQNDINFVANYTGVPLVSILQVAGIPAGNLTFRVVSQDGYSAAMSLRQIEYSILAFAQDEETYDLDLTGRKAVKLVPMGMTAEFWIKVPVEIRIYSS